LADLAIAWGGTQPPATCPRVQANLADGRYRMILCLLTAVYYGDANFIAALQIRSARNHFDHRSSSGCTHL
jgi:hypothetical protein